MITDPPHPMTGLLTPLDELPLFNGELEALLEENMSAREAETTAEEGKGATALAGSSTAQDLGGQEYISSGDESSSSDQISTDLQILQQKIQEGLAGMRWKPKFPQQLTPEGEEKRRVRRERNRQAASRCRDRRRERTFALVQESEKFEDDNQSLMSEIQELERQKRELEEWIVIHQQSGQCIKQIEEIHIDP
ncbi:Proto-oncogene c-Fos [Holothuria leucospilota]|uniref:Proto-oncogene c-Fos n=1 Tax=Holothuria leucospilota TaxID=206669 RepID=A0A9Q1BL39_HOLLE|nr:Proto-oncogene c-Fos [Holothuria leucospilota]